jgi:hypothetical protein
MIMQGLIIASALRPVAEGWREVPGEAQTETQATGH